MRLGKSEKSRVRGGVEEGASGSLGLWDKSRETLVGGPRLPGGTAIPDAVT